LSQLDQIFEKQAHAAAKVEASEADALRAFVLLTIGASRLAVPIERLREVVEATPVTPYPIREDGYVGIANLRGNLLPVVTPEHLSKASCGGPCGTRLLVVFETEGGALLGLGVSAVRKILVAPEDLPRSEGTEHVIPVDGEPIRLLTLSAFGQAQGDVS
jgi:purine-binding chemotaxis protein CheW